MSDSPSSPGSAVTLYLVAIQVASRLLTFVGNQFLLRYVSPSLLGLAVQLELLTVTILYSSRESLRVALQRKPVTSGTSSAPTSDEAVKSSVARQMQEAVNMSYLVIVVGIFNSLLFGYGYLRKSSSEVLQSDDFWLAWGFYITAVVIELCAERYFVVIQQQSLYKARAKAETAAATVKCLGACVVAIGMSRTFGSVSVRPFAVGQLFYAFVLYMQYQSAISSVRHTMNFTLLPQRLSDSTGSVEPTEYWLGYFSKPLLNWTLTFYAQSIFKLLLTQGDSLILSFVADLSSQGAFALASNYGGLMSRLLFQPVEESSRNIFGRLLASANSGDNDGTINHAKGKEKDSKARISSGQADVDRALSHLSTTLHLYTLFALPLVALLPHLFPIVVSNLVGARWSSPATARLLSAYAYYLPFLAINGVLDAFVTSAASPKQLRRQNITMMLITVSYGIVAWILMADQNNTARTFQLQSLAMGPAGLVWANIFNMTLRIIYSIWFITKWVNQHDHSSSPPPPTNKSENTTSRPRSRSKAQSLWRNSLPSPIYTITALAVAIGLNMTLSSNTSTAQKRFLGIKGLDTADIGSFTAAALVLGTSMLFFEYRFLSSTVMTIVPERLASKFSRYLPTPNKPS